MPEKEIRNSLNKLESYFSYIKDVHKSRNYAFPESSVNLPFDDATKDKILKLAEKKKRVT